MCNLNEYPLYPGIHTFSIESLVFQGRVARLKCTDTDKDLRKVTAVASRVRVFRRLLCRLDPKRVGKGAAEVRNAPSTVYE